MFGLSVSLAARQERRAYWMAGGLVSLLALTAGQSSLAQEQPAPGGSKPAAGPAPADTQVEEIVVTGSRIALPAGASSPTPLTVLDSTTVQTMALPNIGDALNQLPSFLNNGEPTQTTALSPQNIGSNIVDLRGLGADRTLVLVDGRRFVPSTETGTVDLNLIPSELVQRTEIVTGGASAAYGSDAVAGVVNLILDNRLDGIRGQVQYGIAQAGDNRDFQASLAGGTDYLDGRAHVVFGFDYEKNDGMGDYYSRNWSRYEWCDVANATPGVNGHPANNILPHCHSSLMTPGGLIVGGPLNGTQFSANGTPEPFHRGTLPGFLFMSGGDGYGENPFFLGPEIEPQFERYSLYAHSDFDVGGDVHPFAELSYGSVQGSDVGAQLRAFPGTIKLSVENPYLPSSIRAAMVADDLSSITIGRAGNDLGNALGESDTSTVRMAVGAKGVVFGSWTWDGYYQFGHNEYDQYEYDDIIPARLALAVDAVVGPNGKTVCRSTLTDPGNGCQPLDLIGQNNFTQAARDYVMGTSEQLNTNDQHVLSANVQGEPIELWYGPLSVAAGAEYRIDSLDGQTDPTSAANGFYVFNGQNIDGSVRVAEGYIETIVPILKDLPFAKTLELNGAVRETGYSLSGLVTTWKAGFVYEPDDTFRLRGTRSRDIRAPNIFELFSPVTAGFTTVIDEKTGVETLPRYFTGGSRDLKPEISDTRTAGIVVTPKFADLDGLSLSVDYYDIKVHDVISEQGGQIILNNCEAGDTADCALITRDANGNVSAITDTYANLNELRTRGIDFEIDYRHDLPWELGALSFRGLATYVQDLTTVTDNGKSAVNEAGVDGDGGMPHLQATTYLTWSQNPWSVTVQNRYVEGGKFSPLYVGPQDPGYSPYLPNSINTNRVAGRLYTNLSMSYDVIATDHRQLQAYLVVNNLFDQNPPVDPGAASATNTMLFDAIGRAFTVGMRFKY
jgi:outer membrane receptor protein involved in Fe transport